MSTKMASRLQKVLLVLPIVFVVGFRFKPERGCCTSIFFTFCYRSPRITFDDAVPFEDIHDRAEYWQCQAEQKKKKGRKRDAGSPLIPTNDWFASRRKELKAESEANSPSTGDRSTRIDSIGFGSALPDILKPHRK
ncbi:unnamed protein product [Amoebophrya sp. A25]|nr:unnamed protein product [Amoebophrya sp. A25]|eukprot:GSA25T00024728001.1